MGGVCGGGAMLLGDYNLFGIHGAGEWSDVRNTKVRYMQGNSQRKLKMEGTKMSKWEV